MFFPPLTTARAIDCVRFESPADRCGGVVGWQGEASKIQEAVRGQDLPFSRSPTRVRLQ